MNTNNLHRMNVTDHIASAEDELENGPGQLFLLVFLSVQGTIGNILIIVAVATDKRLHSYTDAFIVNVAVMDLIVTSFIIPSMVPLLLAGENIYPHALCQVIALMTCVLVTSSLSSLTAVAINRYIFILHQAQYTVLYNRWRVGLMLAGCWLYGLVISLPTVFGWGGLDYRPAAALCCYDHTASLSHLIYISILAVCVPAGSTFTAYGKIAFTLYKSKQRVAAHGAAAGNAKSRKNTQIRTMFIVSSLFSVFWGPYSVVCILEHIVAIPPVYIRAVGWLGMANSCANSIVLGAVNKNYRAAFKRILCCGRGQQQNDSQMATQVTRTHHN